MNISPKGTVFGNGRALAIAPADIYQIAKKYGIEPAVIEAIAEVESNGFGWFKDGRMKILFEKHWFYKQLKAAQRDNAVKQGLARSAFISPKNGGYKEQKTASQRYSILSKAMVINEEMALRSISMGRFQIMGFNYKICGYSSAKDMWAAFLDSEQNQLTAFVNFLLNKKLINALVAKDFDRIETIYNGGGLGGAYARKMQKAYVKLKPKWDAYQAPVKPIALPNIDPVSELPSSEPIAPDHDSLLTDLAADGRLSTTNVAAGIGTAGGAVATGTKIVEVAQQAQSLGQMVLNLSPWIIAAVAIVGAWWWIRRERNRYKALASEKLGVMQ